MFFVLFVYIFLLFTCICHIFDICLICCLSCFDICLHFSTCSVTFFLLLFYSVLTTFEIVWHIFNEFVTKQLPHSARALNRQAQISVVFYQFSDIQRRQHGGPPHFSQTFELHRVAWTMTSLPSVAARVVTPSCTPCTAVPRAIAVQTVSPHEGFTARARTARRRRCAPPRCVLVRLRE